VKQRLLSPRDLGAMALLALLPALAHAPAWLDARLLGPGDGAALHYPLRTEVWGAWYRGELPSWNPWIFSGTPLLAAYRPGALHPLMALLAPLPPFVAFQVLVLLSLGAAGVLTYVYLRRLGAGRVGAYVAGLGFALGPYLVGHLGDTPGVVAAPLLPLLLLTTETLLREPSPRHAAGLAASIALLLLCGSPEATRAGAALLFGRLLVARLQAPFPPARSWRAAALALLCGMLLAAPQLVPTLYALPEAGRQVTGLAPQSGAPLPGLTGLVLRYVSHTPAGALAAAALPLVRSALPIRVLGLSLALCLALQWGRGPLAAPGALGLVFDFSLAILAGLSLDAQWRERRRPRGRRLRLLFLVACLFSAAALSVAAAALGPLPQTLAGAVGVLAVALILYFSLAEDKDPVLARVFLLPLTASFLLQPQGRELWSSAPTRAELEQPSATRQAIDNARAPRPGERSLTLTREWPAEARDLGYANLGALAERRSANGYDPMVPLRSRALFDGMGPAGLLPGAFLRSDPRRLETLGLRFVQVPASALRAEPDAHGLGDTLDVTLEPGRPRFFPIRAAVATELRLASHLSNAVAVAGGQRVARIEVRLASGRSLPLELVAGRDTAEWSIERPDVKGKVRHPPAPLLESWPAEGFAAHRYLGVLALPGRYLIDGVRIEALPGAGLLSVSRMSARDAATGRVAPVSLAAAFVSDSGVFRELVAIPGLRLLELPRSPGRAHVAARVRALASDAAVLGALQAPRASGLQPRDAVALESDLVGVQLPAPARGGDAVVARALGGHLDVRGDGPGVLVVAEGWDPGWSASLDGAPVRVFRVNHAQLGMVLPAGTHRVTLVYRPRGFLVGVALFGVGVVFLALGGRVLASPAPAASRA
jgi:hypothetical protein